MSKFECAINRSACGINEYVPIQFQGNHYCQVEASLHTFLLGRTTELLDIFRSRLVITTCFLIEFRFSLSDYQQMQVNNKVHYIFECLDY